MKKSKIILVLIIAMTCFFGALESSAVVFNGAFETGDFSGWIVDIPYVTSKFSPEQLPAGTSGIITDFTYFSQGTISGSSILPVEGNYFASIGSGGSVYSSEPMNSIHITAAQGIYLNEGDKVSGWISFYNGDFEPQDSGWITIKNQNGDNIADLWHEYSGYPGYELPGNPSTIEYMSATPWTYWEWIAPHSEVFALEFRVTSGGDNRFASYVFLDDIRVTPVPEPASIAMLSVGLALFGLVGINKRYKNTILLNKKQMALERDL